MNIIVKLSFWIMKAIKQTKKESTSTAFEQGIMDALAKFKRDGYVEKLMTSITSESLPSEHGDLLAFLCNQIAHT
jgi:hypothetical protein